MVNKVIEKLRKANVKEGDLVLLLPRSPLLPILGFFHKFGNRYGNESYFQIREDVRLMPTETFSVFGKNEIPRIGGGFGVREISYDSAEVCIGKEPIIRKLKSIKGMEIYAGLLERACSR